MAKFDNARLAKLSNPALLVEVAQATHVVASRLQSKGLIPNYYFDSEIYEWGEEQTLPSGETYHEISRYSDGYGASLFVKDDEMLLLTSDHEYSPEGAIDGDRDLYLTPIVAGLPRKWDFVVDMLQIQERFELNPPAGIFWFKDGQWNITDTYEEIKNASRTSALYDYRFSVDLLSVTGFDALFDHAGLDAVDEQVIEASLEEWIH